MNEDKKQEVDVEMLLQRADHWTRDNARIGAWGLITDLAAALQDARNCKVDTTRAETPDAKRDDVEALLVEADRADASLFSDPRVCLYGRLAAALRAERTRADGWRRVGEDNDRHAFEACGHLVVVVQHGWPDGTTAPACVRAAREFLAGKEVVGDLVAAQMRATSAENEAAELRRLLAAHQDERKNEAAKLRADLATLNRLHEEATRERDKLEAALSSERDRHAKTRAKLQAEDEAHANTRAEWDAARATLREIFDAFEFTLGDPSRPEHVVHVVAEAKKQCRLQDTVNALETRLANITRNPFAYITPKNEAERGILESVRAAVKGNSGNGAAMIFDLLVHATRVAGERADQLARLAAADEKSFADLAVMAERSWKEQAPFASVKIAFEWGFVRGAQSILGAKGGA